MILRTCLGGAGGIGGLLASQDTGGTSTTADDRTFLYFYDGNGNVGQLLETTAGANYGTIAARYEYDAYGNNLLDPTNGGWPCDGLGAMPTRLCGSACG